VELLVGRLALQDQRVARAEEAVQRLDGEVSGLEQDRRRIDGEFRDFTRALEQETSDAERAALDQQLRRARVRHGELMSRLGPLEGRRSEAKQALVAEQRRYQELESRLTDLDRALQAIDR
jgi:predicted  nucleic acid-binding Zn-ribbon protein